MIAFDIDWRIVGANYEEGGDIEFKATMLLIAELQKTRVITEHCPSENFWHYTAEAMTPEIKKILEAEFIIERSEDPIYVDLWEAASKLPQQTQYFSRFFDAKVYPEKFLGEGIRIKGSVLAYHEMKIHRDDIEEAVKRVHHFYATTERMPT